MDITKIRKETPGVQECIHFNNAGAALPTRMTLDAMIHYLEQEALCGGYAMKEKSADLIAGFYKNAARLINCQPEEISITENASVGFDKVLLGIPFAPGDIILTSAIEYNNNYLNYLKLKKEKGIEIKLIPNDEKGVINVSKIPELIDKKVKLIAITHVPTNGGVIAPAEAVGKIASAHNILYLLDACQSVGHLPVDVRKIKCDFLSTTSRKYLRGPRGLGFLYAKASARQQITPLYLDNYFTQWNNADSYTLHYDNKIFENWEKPYALIAGFSEAIRYLNELGIQNTWSRIRTLSAYLRQALEVIPDVKLLDIGHEKCGIVSFVKKDVSPMTVFNKLLSKKINISVSNRKGTLIDMDNRKIESLNRASVHYYNTEEEIDVLVKAIQEC